jgi:hypothetical protein
MKDVEEAIEVLFDQNSSGVFSKEELHTTIGLGEEKEVLLDLEETKWRLKS